MSMIIRLMWQFFHGLTAPQAERYHYLGHKHLIGSNLRHFIVDGQGRKLGCFLFQYALKALPRRDEWSGWVHQKQRSNRSYARQSNRARSKWIRKRNQPQVSTNR